ncbi:MAG TPA: arginine deiminase-related protein [Ignavibacteriaceae bacterium]|nr:arginine deiminase-related protein [Ignavibacteriaceae bacterium]
MFKTAIVKRPCKNMVNGITSASLGKPDYILAMKQHQEYIDVLKEAGLEVIVLNADENYPDSVFVEDTALLTPHFAVITNPGADSRRGEIFEMNQVLENLFPMIESISTPGTLDAGDVMMVGNHFYIGLSERTNLFGANQLIGILAKFGFIGSTITLKDVLHLKSGVSYLENNNLLLTSDFINKKEFQKFNKISVDDGESYAGNSLWINDRVLVPKGFPKTKAKIEQAGYNVIEVDVSEFRKLDGGLSCLSLRF